MSGRMIDADNPARPITSAGERIPASDTNAMMTMRSPSEVSAERRYGMLLMGSIERTGRNKSLLTVVKTSAADKANAIMSGREAKGKID